MWSIPLTFLQNILEKVYVANFLEWSHFYWEIVILSDSIYNGKNASHKRYGESCGMMTNPIKLNKIWCVWQKPYLNVIQLILLSSILMNNECIQNLRIYFRIVWFKVTVQKRSKQIFYIMQGLCWVRSIFSVT